MRFLLRSLPVLLLSIVPACAAPEDDDVGSQSLAAYAGVRLTANQIANHARAAGLPCNTIVTATAVALGESDGYTRATHYNADSVDRGIWQINSKYWPMYSETCVFDAACNAKAMAAISNNGSNWTPWLAYTNGRYQMFWNDAQAGYDQGVTGCTAGGGNSGGSSPRPSTPTNGGITGTIWDTGGIGLTIRSSATPSSSALGVLSEGATITITCQARGETVQGHDVWDYLADRGGWVSDRFVYTGVNGFHPDAPRCR